jgi:putative oxidoreductase
MFQMPSILRAGAEPGRSLAALLLRLGLATPFYFSGLTKWESFGTLSDSAVLLFTEEFRLHLGFAEIPYPHPELMALASGLAEISLPVLLVLGLFTRLAALGLLGMTVIIELTVPDGWPVHITWAAMALALAVHGGGRWSVDRFAFRNMAGT